MRALLFFLLFLLLALAALSPALGAPHLFSAYYDWRYFDTTAEIARRTLLWYHQAPLWNPYSCGGEVDLANPQSLEAAPTFLLVLLFGTALGTKLTLLSYYAMAMDGTFRLARRIGAGTEGALLAACGFGLSGYLGMHLAAGHTNFAGVALYPYLLLCYDRALDNNKEGRRYVIPLGLCAAWIAVLGGTFTPPMGGILLLLWGALRAAEDIRRAPGSPLLPHLLRPLWVLALGGALALCFGAVRMLPTLEFIHDHPRPAFRKRVPDFSWPHQVFLDLVAWRKYEALEGRKYWAHEYSARLPFALLPLWLLSLGWLRRSVPERSRWIFRRLWLVALAAALLAMGNAWPLFQFRGRDYVLPLPWSLLQQLPVLRDLRVPSRHLVLLTLPLALLAGLTWERLRTWLALRGRPAVQIKALFAVLFLLSAADGVIYSASLWRDQFHVTVSAPAGPVPFSFVTGHWRTMREDVFSGHGTLGCDEEAPLQRAEVLETGPVPQARLQDPTLGAVQEVRVTPNQRSAKVVLAPGGTKDADPVLLLNSNWNEHWKLVTPTGTSAHITRVAGRLAVDLRGLPPGPHEIVVRYAPRSFVIGAVLSALAIPLGLLIFFLLA